MSETKYLTKALDNFNLSNVNFNKDGLLPVISQCLHTGKVLMMAWMNEDALRKTIETNDMYYFSRSRSKLWRKGETSGHFQKLYELRLDCDNDTLLALIEQSGFACHTGAESCFFKNFNDGKDG
jgi:phosphoribosyl-AMP cyclohydrolase